MNEAGPAITRFAFANGMLRGTHLTLYPTCLVHRSDTHLETLPVAAMTAVSVAFRRDARKLGWGIALVGIALLLLAASGPLDGFAAGAATDMAKSEQGVGKALYGFFRFLMALASLLPAAALACVIGGGALCAYGWMGTTTMLVSLPGTERIYPARGRSTMLLDFAEALSERLMLLKR
jgi:hypothetical protein